MRSYCKNQILYSTLFLSALTLLWNNYSWSEHIDSIQESKLHDSDQNNSPKSPGWTLYGGIGTGYGSVSSTEFLGGVSGGQFLLNGLVAYQIPHWVFDGGFSWFYSNLGGINSQNLPIQIQTRAGMFDLSPRYRVGERWQVGPILNLAFGTDTTFGSRIVNSNNSIFLGAKGVYEFPSYSYAIRLWAQLSTDVSISNREVFFGTRRNTDWDSSVPLRIFDNHVKIN